MSLMAKMQSEKVVTHEEEWFSTTKYPYEFVLELKEGLSFSDFRKAIEVLLKERQDRGGYTIPTTYFRKPSRVYHRRQKKTIEVTEYKCRYFISTDNNLCYTQSSRTGLYVSSRMEWENIQRIIMIHQDHPDLITKREEHKEKLWNRINKARYDEVTWSNLTKDSFPNGGDRFYYINKIFNESIICQIEEAFRNKTEFQFISYGQKRDYSVSGRMCGDGIYRAWFSSEYKGCGNGDYYLLLNPRVAVFYEHD